MYTSLITSLLLFNDTFCVLTVLRPVNRRIEQLDIRKW